MESARKAIMRGTGVLSAEEIASQIAGAIVQSPSLSAVTQAESDVASAAAKLAAEKQNQQHWAGIEKPLAESVAGTKQTISDLESWFSGVQKSFDAFASYRDWAWSGAGRYHESMALVPENQRRTAQYAADLASYTAQREAAEAKLATEQAALSAASNETGKYAQQVAAAQNALAAARQVELEAKTQYASAVAQFVADAGSSVSKLSDLRGEVMSFYEAQVQAVQGMLQSAGNLRSVVDQVRLGQLTTAQTAAELGHRYAMDYSMAMVTTGAARAGYVDAMAGNLQGLSEALKAEAATGADWRIQTAKLLAQASNAAGLLEGDAKADDYKDVALGLLGNIDSALANLSGSTKSAEQVIADAINKGTHAQLEGLRAIVAALKGESVPAFAAGGFHSGGLRIVGENGPELEATGPSRIWTAQQTRSMFSGNGSMDALVAELRLLREENQAQALALVSQQEQVNRLLMRWETQGMPEERDTV